MRKKSGQPRHCRKSIVQVVAAAIVTGAAPVAAQVDTSEWKCEFCPFDDGYRASYEAGADYVSDKAARFGNATGYDDEGGYVNLGGEGTYRSDGIQADWRAEDLGLDSRRLRLDAGRQGRYDAYLDYSELPYRRFDTTATVYSETAPGQLTLPSNWVAAPGTAGFTSLATSLQPLDIGSDRSRIAAGGRIHATSNFSVYADYRHEARDGVDIVSGPNFTQSSLLPRFLDFETDLVDVGVRYANGPLSLSVAWFGSFFDNQLDSLTWENAFTSPPGEEQRRSAQEPDNDFQQVSLSGRYRAGLMNTVIAFSAATGRGEQDQSLLPYTINPALPVNPLPGATLGGRVDTANYALTITAQPVDRARLTLAYRYDDRDNRTPPTQWSRVIVDTFQSGDIETNAPYSFTRATLAASGSYRLSDALRLSAGYDRKEIDRDFQEVAEQTEDSGWGRLRWRTDNGWEVALKGGAAKREIDRYDTAVAASLGQNPLMRKYNLAYRYREFGELTASGSPGNGPVNVGLSALWADDGYDKSTVGMTDSESLQWNVDLAWTVSDTSSVFLFGGMQNIDANQAGSDGFGAPDWFAMHEDEFHIYGGGIRFDPSDSAFRYRLEVTRTDGSTAITVDRNGMSPAAFPDLDSRQTSARLVVDYERSERLAINVDVRYESFSTNDWALAGVEPDTLPTVLTMGADPYDYDVWVVGLGFRYRVGE